MSDPLFHAESLAQPTALLSDVHDSVVAMQSDIRALFPGARLSGPAKTVRTPPGQNKAIHQAVHTASRGDVLVVDCNASADFGAFGDILAEACVRRGVAGLVIDGGVRDSADITERGFPVFMRAACPRPTKKTESGEVNVEVTCGGVRVRPRDYIVGDEDGVVVVPRELLTLVRDGVERVLANEQAIRMRMQAGETTWQILGFTSRS